MARAVPIPPEQEQPVEEKSLAELLRQILHESGELIQKEFQLAREELALTIREAGIASSKLAAGVVFSILALGFLGFAVIVLLSAFITPWLSAAIVGFLFLLAGAILMYSAAGNFRGMGVPQTVETLKEDAEWLKHPTKPEGK
jgi:uncharacterized membrane protein YqjE